MKKDKKILVSDYDQTFYLNDEDIEKNKIAVKQKCYIFKTFTFFLKESANHFNLSK